MYFNGIYFYLTKQKQGTKSKNRKKKKKSNLCFIIKCLAELFLNQVLGSISYSQVLKLLKASLRKKL